MMNWLKMLFLGAGPVCAAIAGALNLLAQLHTGNLLHGILGVLWLIVAVLLAPEEWRD